MNNKINKIVCEGIDWYHQRAYLLIGLDCISPFYCYKLCFVVVILSIKLFRISLECIGIRVGWLI